jgi:hypothetical protein
MERIVTLYFMDFLRKIIFLIKLNVKKILIKYQYFFIVSYDKIIWYEKKEVCNPFLFRLTGILPGSV